MSSQANVKPESGDWGRLKFLRWPRALLSSLIFTLFLLYTYIFPLNGIIFSRDYILQLWDLWWVNEAITSGHSPYFTPLFYYPLGADLGRHVLSPGFFPLTFLVWLLSGLDPLYPLYTYKIIILISYALILYFCYRVLRELGLGRWPSFIPAVAYTFGNFYMHHMTRLHIISAFFVPLTALVLIRLYKRPARSTALIAALLLGCGFYFTELTLYVFISLGLVAAVLMLLPAERPVLVERVRRLGFRTISLSGLVLVLVSLPFVYHWLVSEAEPPDLVEASWYSANLAGFFVPTPDTTPLYGSLFAGLNEQVSTGVGGYEAFVGFPLLIFGLLGAFKAKQKPARMAAWFALFFFILSLGPGLKVLALDTGVPLPYSLIAAVPPFNVGRTPVRFVAIASFFWMIPAGYGLQWLREWLAARSGPRVALAALLVIFTWTTAEVFSPIQPLPPYKTPPQVAAVVEGPLINLPLKRHDGWALLFQMAHKQPTATGYVSRNSRQQLEYFETLRNVYSEAVRLQSCEPFVKLGFRNVMIWPGVPDEVIAALKDPARCSMNVVDVRDWP